MHELTNKLKKHYTNTFLKHGANASGVDWVHEDRANLRHQIMSTIIINDYLHKNQSIPSLLDVGCGYGEFFNYLNQSNISVNYTGIDVVQEMIAEGKLRFPSAEFISDDFLSMNLSKSYDYIVCNGILTQKLDLSIIQMDAFAEQIVKKMFQYCTKAIAFNIMTTKVNFMAPNLYYRNPADMLLFCLNALSTKVRIEHAYNLFEYTVFVYREG